MIELFDKPKYITLRELRESDDYFIQKVEYGDFDNYVTIIIKDVLFRNSSFINFKEDCGVFKKDDFVTHLEIEAVYVHNAEEYGIDKAKTETMCSTNPIILRSIEDIDKIKIPVFGIWKIGGNDDK